MCPSTKLGEVHKRTSRSHVLRGRRKRLEHAHPWELFFSAQELTQHQTCMNTDPALAQALLGHHLKHALKACEAAHGRAAAQRALYRGEPLTLALQLMQT